MGNLILAIRIALRVTVVAVLMTLSVGVIFPGSVWADDCEQDCLRIFQECKACSSAWEGTNGVYSHCAGTFCYYICGSECVIEET